MLGYGTLVTTGYYKQKCLVLRLFVKTGYYNKSAGYYEQKCLVMRPL